MADTTTIEVLGTTFKTWSELVNYLALVGVDITAVSNISDVNELIAFLKTINIVPITTVGEYISGFATVSNVDPANTTAVATRVVTDLVTTGGVASSVSVGKKTFTTLARRVVAGALVAALSVDAVLGSLAQYIDNLVEGLTPFTTDGDSVPVIVDENGKIYLDKRTIDAMRSTLVDIGAFNSGGVEPGYDVGQTVTNVHADSSKLNSVFTQMRYNSHNYIDNNNDFYAARYGQGWHDVIDDAFNYFINNAYRLGTLADNQCYMVRLNGAGSMGNRADFEFMIIDTKPNVSSLIDLNTDASTNLRYAGELNSEDSISYLRFRSNIFEWPVGRQYLRYYGDMTYGSATYTVNQSNTGLFTKSSAGTIVGGTSSYGIAPVSFSGTVASSSYSVIIGDVDVEAAIEGVTPNVPAVGNLSLGLNEIFPTWANSSLPIPVPTAEDLGNTVDYYPVTVENVEPFESDIESSAEDKEGETSDDSQQELINDLMGIIQQLIRNQTDGESDTPTVPVGDSGDTPPEAPPLVSGASNGLWTIYNPTLSEVQQFGAWLWSENLIDQIVRQFNNPIQAVIGFMTLYATPITGSRKVIKAGYLSSPVSALEVTNQYIEIDCGSVEVEEFYKTAIDYTRTKIDIYLPFIGIVPLDSSVVMGSTVQVIYRIDVLTGTCLAQIKVIKENSDAVMYTYNGNCAVQLPLTASTYTGVVGTLIGLGSTILSAGAGDVGGTIGGIGKAVMSGISNLSGVAKSGTLSSNAGALGIRIPYMIITHPTAYDAFNYQKFYGYPSNLAIRLGEVTGFCRVKDVHLENINCTDVELDMIYKALKEGVII